VLRTLVHIFYLYTVD